MPFREAHGVVGALVRAAAESGRRLSELDPEKLRKHSELLDDSYYEILRDRGWIESKRSSGGTSSEAVAAQLEEARAALAEIRDPTTTNVPESSP